VGVPDCVRYTDVGVYRGVVEVSSVTIAFGSIRTDLEPGSPLTYKLNNTLDDVSSAARAVRQLADYLEQNPSAVLRGRGGSTQLAR
jgi:hypothetical protein